MARRLRQIAAWLWIGITLFYVLFAFSEAAATALDLLGLTGRPATRSAPPIFVLHALTGGIALSAGSLQLTLVRLPLNRRRLHKWLGLTYVVTACATSLLSLWVVAGFQVSAAAKAGFIAEAALWAGTTLTAYVSIRRRQTGAHREWMIRSFAVALFFMSFSLWDPIMEMTPLPAADAYALAVFLGWAVNLLLAETYIRRTRQTRWIATPELSPTGTLPASSRF